MELLVSLMDGIFTRYFIDKSFDQSIKDGMYKLVFRLIRALRHRHTRTHIHI